MELQAAVDAFLRSRELRCTIKTLAGYAYDITAFLRSLWAQGIEDTADLTAKHVEEFLTEARNRGVNNNSLRSYRARAAAFVNWCGQQGHCPEGIMLRVHKPRASQHIRKTYSEEEIHALLEFARLRPVRYWAAFDVALLMVLMDTGVRITELCNLNVGDLAKGGRMKVCGKGDKERYVIVSPATGEALASYLKFRGPLRPTDPLFISALGRRVSHGGLYQRVRRLGHRIGVETHPHKFRHTFALMALKNGANPKALQLFLGHSKLATTDEYLKGFSTEDALRDHQGFSPIAAMMKH